MRLRDIELRPSNDGLAPEEFWRRGPVQYVFYRELRALKIETPGIAKINVYCEPAAIPYQGYVHDGVTDVHIKSSWDTNDPIPSTELVRTVAALLTSGTETVLNWFKIDAPGVGDIAPRLEAGAVWAPVPIGKSATQSPDKEYSARLSVRSSDDLRHMMVSLAVSRRRTIVSEQPVCVTSRGSLSPMRPQPRRLTCQSFVARFCGR